MEGQIGLCAFVLECGAHCALRGDGGRRRVGGGDGENPDPGFAVFKLVGTSEDGHGVCAVHGDD